MDRRLPAAELALAALTAAAAVGLGRLFAEATYLGPVLVAAGASHGLAWLARRRGVPTPLSLLVSVLSMMVVTAWLMAGPTTFFGFPTPETWASLTGDLRSAWDEFGVIKAPAPALPGFVAAAVMGTWLAAALADWAAFRLGTAFEAVVPSFTLFVFGSALAADRYRLAASAAYLAALLAFLLLHHANRQAEGTSWFATRQRPGPRAIVKGGVVIAAVTLLAAVVAGPALPGAGADPVLDWRGGDGGPGSRITTSPLVDIRSRLVNQSALEVFQVRTDARSYWRLTSLDTFTGAIWSSVDSYRPAEGRLPAGVGTLADERTAEQEFRITALSDIWLPAAFRPLRFDGPGGVRYNADSATLLTEDDTVDGLTYRVESALPVPQRDQLAAVPDVVPLEVADRYLQLPPDFPDRVDALAHRVVREAGATTPYEAALALQNFLRQFRYSLDVKDGHSDDVLVAFLFETRAGYCEQFAGAYAAMARSVGLPARVAVGFTPGDFDAATGIFHVRGEHAHAWPEVFLAGYGWVPFEPTPGRGVPNAEGYTGVPEAQSSEGGRVATTLPPTTVAPTIPGPGGGTAPTTTLPDNDRILTNERAWPSGAVVAVLAVVALAVGWVVAVPSALGWRHRRRRARAVTPAARVQLAWVEATEALATAGARRLPAETPAEYAGRVAGVFGPAPAAGGDVVTTGNGAGDGQPAAGDPGRALVALAQQTTAAAFAPVEPAPEVVDVAERLSSTVVERVTRLTRPVERARRKLDPRPLWRRNGDSHIAVE